MPSLNHHARGSAACARLLLLVSAALVVSSADARAASVSLIPRPPGIGMRARDGLDAAKALARGWAPDASLVYIESQDELFEDATARAWTYLYWSPRERSTRGWIVRQGGATSAVELAFPFDPPPLEDGWQDAMKAFRDAAKDPAFASARAGGGLRTAMIANGLWTDSGPPRTAWLFGFGQRGPGDQEWIGDALRGTALAERAAWPAESVGNIAGGRAALPPWLGAHATVVLTRVASLRDDPARVLRDRERWLLPHEASALTRLSAQDAGLDSVGRGAANAATADVDASLNALNRWNSAAAYTDSLLARSAQRIESARADLAAERPTELAVYLAVASRARPERVSLVVDGLESARATYGDLEWRALDSGAWAEVARRTVRSGPREVRVDIEDADHRIKSATWRGTFAAGKLTVLRLRLTGGEGATAAPALEYVLATTP